MNKFIFKRLRQAMDADQDTIDELYKKVRKLKEGEYAEEPHALSYRVSVLAVLLITVAIGIFTGVAVRKNSSEVKSGEGIETIMHNTETDKEEKSEEIGSTEDKTKADKEEESEEIPTTTGGQRE